MVNFVTIKASRAVVIFITLAAILPGYAWFYLNYPSVFLSLDALKLSFLALTPPVLIFAMFLTVFFIRNRFLSDASKRITGKSLKGRWMSENAFIKAAVMNVELYIIYFTLYSSFQDHLYLSRVVLASGGLLIIIIELIQHFINIRALKKSALIKDNRKVSSISDTP